MHKKQQAALTLAVLAAAVSVALPTEAARQQDAEKAVAQAAQPVPETISEKAAVLAHSKVKVSSFNLSSNSVLTKEKIISLVPELGKDTIDVAKLGREIALYNQGGAIKIFANFEQQGDGYRLHVNSATGKHVTAGIWFSNNGNTYTGDWRGTVTYVNRNLTGRGDTLGAAVISSLDHAGDVRQGAVSYRFNLPKAADTMTISASLSDSKLSDLAKGYPFDISSTGKSARVGLSGQHYLANSSREKDYFDLGLSYHHSKSDASLTWGTLSVPFGKYSVNHLDTTLSFRHQDAGLSHRFHYGLGVQTNLTSDEDDFHEMTPGSDKHYYVFHADASYQKKLPGDWLFMARTMGQYTSQDLIGCEKFGAGGMDSVRGFDENIRTADKGISGSLEIYTPVCLKGLRALAFVDGASLRNNRSGSAGTDLASSGLGLRYSHENLRLALDYAWVLHEPDSVEHDPAGHRRWNFWGGFTF